MVWLNLIPVYAGLMKIKFPVIKRNQEERQWRMGRHIPSMLYACMKMALCDLAPLKKKVESISSLIWKLIMSMSTNVINPLHFENVSLNEEEGGCGGNLIFLAWNKPRISSTSQEPMMPTRTVADSKCLHRQSWRDSRTCLPDKSEGTRTH